MAPTVYQYPEGWMELWPIASGFHVELQPREEGSFLAQAAIDTSFRPEIVRQVAACFGFPWTCEVIARHQNPYYLERILKRQLLSYFSPAELRGKRVLDFGCGSGASTLCLARLLPDSEIAGVDFDAARLGLARNIAESTGVANASFHLSPAPMQLPAGLEPPDFIVMSAVYQHMLPAERAAVTPALWKLLRPGGSLLVNQTSHRWFPWEPDTSGLLLINYLPDRIAGYVARNLSSRDENANRDRDWTALLRAGLRGASEREILDRLPANATVMQPVTPRTRADYWRDDGAEPGLRITRSLAAELFRWTDRRWGVVPSKHLDMVVRKLG